MSLVKSLATVGSALTKQFNGFGIRVRDTDGYIHATDMCKVGKSKKWAKYRQLTATQAFIKELSAEVQIPIRELFQSNKGGDSKLQGTWVHPHIAINLAQWVSPIFAVKVAGWVSRFISGDPTIIKETIQNANIATGLVNNIETATDPDTNEVSMIITTFEKNDYMAKIKSNNLKKHIQELIDEKNGIIAKKECQITELIKRLDESEIKADAERAKSEARFQKLLGVAENTNIRAIESESKADEERVKANIARIEVGEALKRSIPTDVPDGDKTQVWIIRDKSAEIDEYNLYPIRSQLKSMNSAIKKLKSKYGDELVVTYKIEQPNAVIFWNCIKKRYSLNIDKCSDSGWFKLNQMTLKNFKKNIIIMDKERLTYSDEQP